MIAEPRTVHAVPRMRAVAELAVVVTTEPWALSRAHHAAALAAGLTDEDVLHAIVLSSYFGHLNRIADAVAVPLDYVVQEVPPPIDPSVPPWPAAPAELTGRPAIELALRPTTAAALAAWRTYVFEREAPLTRRQRMVLGGWVGRFLGDGGLAAPEELTHNPIDHALRELAEVVTLAPWRVTSATFSELRAYGLDDAALFDACAVISSATVFARVAVALVALAR